MKAEKMLRALSAAEIEELAFRLLAALDGREQSAPASPEAEENRALKRSWGREGAYPPGLKRLQTGEAELLYSVPGELPAEESGAGVAILSGGEFAAGAIQGERAMGEDGGRWTADKDMEEISEFFRRDSRRYDGAFVRY